MRVHHSVVFNKTNCIKILQGNNITTQNLEYWYQVMVNLAGTCHITNRQRWIHGQRFLGGIITELMPCAIS